MVYYKFKKCPSQSENVKRTMGGHSRSLSFSRWLRLGRLPFPKTAFTLAGYFLPSAHVAKILSPTENSLMFASLRVSNRHITFRVKEQDDYNFSKHRQFSRAAC